MSLLSFKTELLYFLQSKVVQATELIWYKYIWLPYPVAFSSILVYCDHKIVMPLLYVYLNFCILFTQGNTKYLKSSMDYAHMYKAVYTSDFIHRYKDKQHVDIYFSFCHVLVSCKGTQVHRCVFPATRSDRRVLKFSSLIINEIGQIIIV